MATAYHHVGLGYTPSPSSPYFLFGVQHRAPYNWAGGSGGVPWTNSHPKELGASPCDGMTPEQCKKLMTKEVGTFARRAPVRTYRGLGSADLIESGGVPYSALQQTMLHNPGRYVPVADFPLWRPGGPEAIGLSDNEKKLGIVAALAIGGWILWKNMGRRTNPARRRRHRRARRNPGNPVPYRYEVVASTKRRGRRRYGAIGFTTKTAATAYADDLRKGGHKASVRKRR